MNDKGSDTMKKAVAYYRVSTGRQGESRLGLEAQIDSVQRYIRERGISLMQEFTEVESGKKSKRPVLQAALSFCSANKAILLIAKLDSLGRNVAFISALMESKVSFVAVDFTEANNLVLHILAAFAQYEREQISLRTKSALQAAKRRGVQLRRNGKRLALFNRQSAAQFAQMMKPIITEIKKEGFKTILELTNQLNKKNIPTFRSGCKWHKSTVHKLINRIQIS